MEENDLISNSISSVIEKLKKYSDAVIEDTIQQLLKIKTSKYNYENLKIKKIITNENTSENNPAHSLNLDGNNFKIEGEIGMGKTTFFDKIYDIFIQPKKYGTPIKGWKNTSSLILKSSEVEYQIDIKSNSVDRTSQLLINSQNDLNKLENLGILNNIVNCANF
ncbi:MAG: hypothetical protein GF364_02120, partial [Candidatus Lokiarchaeota archaeon]|nr:hypothetical protein [Candidatus Lokiarchaeota archaeon]